ncbi:MAG: prevent-host-death protein [Fulvimarina sp.]|nr:prevent-host-death protein [Fulvimarina sp.]
MSEVNVKDAQRDLVALVDRVAQGEIVTVTKEGMAVAAIVPIAEAARASNGLPSSRPSLVDYLKTLPVDIEFERNRSPSRDVDF